MFELYTADARRVIVLAQEEARKLNHNYIGTEHLLLALINDHGIAGQALADTGVTHEEAVGHLIEIVGRGFSPVAGHIPFTPRARAVLDAAYRTALKIEHGYIGPEHLLLGLAFNSTSVSGQVILRCGIANRFVTRRLSELMTEQTTPEPALEPRFVLSA